MIKKTILVVDDDKNQAQLFEDFLKENGFDVHVASTGTEALRKALDFKPDMVLLDLYLPDMKGSDVCAQMRASAAMQHIPVILCTAYKIDAIEKIAGFRAGADDYLIRPFMLSELLARMEAIFRRSTSTTVAAKPLTAIAPMTAVSTKKTLNPVRPTNSTPLSQPNFFHRSWETLTHPRQTFKHLEEHSDFVIGLFLVLGTPMISSFSKLFQRSGNFDGWIGVFSLGLVLNALMWLGTAGLLHMLMPFRGISLSMRRALVIAGLSWAPRLFESVLGAVYSAVGAATLGGESANFSAGINIVPGLPTNGFVSVLSHISVFNMWSMMLTLIAVGTLNHGAEKRWNSVTMVVGVACLLFGALLTF